MSKPDIKAVEAYLRSLQLQICSSLEDADGKETFQKDQWDRPGGGGGISRVMVGGDIFEQAGVGFSHAVSYTHLTLPTTLPRCRSRWWRGQ